jgi:MFS family permease
MENTYVPVLARSNFFLSDSQIVSLRSVRNLASLLFRLFSNEIFNRIRYKRLIILLFSVSSPTMFAIPFSPNYEQLLALYFVWGFCFGGLYLLSGVVTSLVSDRSNRGAAFALNSFSSASGNLSSIIIAPIADAMGVSFVFNIGAMLPIIPILLVYKLMAGNEPIG